MRELFQSSIMQPSGHLRADCGRSENEPAYWRALRREARRKRLPVRRRRGGKQSGAEEDRPAGHRGDRQARRESRVNGADDSVSGWPHHDDGGSRSPGRQHRREQAVINTASRSAAAFPPAPSPPNSTGAGVSASSKATKCLGRPAAKYGRLVFNSLERPPVDRASRRNSCGYDLLGFIAFNPPGIKPRSIPINSADCDSTCSSKQ